MSFKEKLSAAFNSKGFRYGAFGGTVALAAVPVVVGAAAAPFVAAPIALLLAGMILSDAPRPKIPGLGKRKPSSNQKPGV